MYYFLVMQHSKSQEFSKPSYCQQTLLCVKIFLFILGFLCPHFTYVQITAASILHFRKQLKHFLTASVTESTH